MDSLSMTATICCTVCPWLWPYVVVCPWLRLYVIRFVHDCDCILYGLSMTATVFCTVCPWLRPCVVRFVHDWLCCTVHCPWLRPYVVQFVHDCDCMLYGLSTTTTVFCTVCPWLWPCVVRYVHDWLCCTVHCPWLRPYVVRFIVHDCDRMLYGLSMTATVCCTVCPWLRPCVVRFVQLICIHRCAWLKRAYHQIKSIDHHSMWGYNWYMESFSLHTHGYKHHSTSPLK